MLIWMLYALLVGLLLSAAAYAAERAARLCRLSTRWIWTLALAAALLLPAGMATVSIALPTLPTATVAVPTRLATAVPAYPLSGGGLLVLPETTRAGLRSSTDRFDPLAWQLWQGLSGGLLLTLLLSAAAVHRQRHHWRRARVLGQEVFLTTATGPAVVGLLAPRIAVPTWLLELPVEQQAAVIAHEQAHIDAGDPLLLLGALVMLVLMPWNPVLWWQLRRLRFAIEIDCDRRVLARGHPPKVYGETLLLVGMRHASFLGAAAAMVESRSFLERRMALMLRTPGKWRRASAAAFSILTFALVATAAELGPPNVAGGAGGTAPATPTGQTAPAMPPGATAPTDADLDRLTGAYALAPKLLLTVSRSGSQLMAQVTGQMAVPIYPESPTHFIYKVVAAQIDFQLKETGSASGLVLHQNGQDYPAQRVTAEAAQQADAALAARVKAQTALPGSAAAARQLMDGLMSGHPDYTRLSPQLGAAVRSQLSGLQAVLTPLGPVTGIEFAGVSPAGWDTYLVRHAHGSSNLRLVLDASGIITGAYANAGP